MLWTGLVGREDGACTDGSPKFLAGGVVCPPYLLSVAIPLWQYRFWFLLGLGDGWAGRCFDASHLEAPVSWLAPALLLLQNAKVRSAERLNRARVDGVNELTVRHVATERGEGTKDGCMHLEEV